MKSNPFTPKELRDRIQKQSFSRWPEDVRSELRNEQAEQDARDQESDVHADAIEALDELEAAQDFNQ